MNVTISLTSSADKEAVMPLLREQYVHHGYPFSESESSDVAGQLLDRSDLGGIWLLKDGQLVAGIMVLAFGYDIEFGGRLAVLTDLYVVEAHRRKGLGTAAIRFAECFCRSHEMRALELQVERSNAGAMAFYERLGFVAHDRVPMTKRLVLISD
jgi:GNAT superfamily N-acetyltransferase